MNRPAEFVNRVIRGDNLDVMRQLPDGCCDLIYVDPPFCTGRPRRASNGQHVMEDRWRGGVGAFVEFLGPRIREMHRLLAERGSLYVHLDWHAVHHVRVLLDKVFGEKNLLNEIIWSYRTGGLSRRWFARKHDTLLLYARHRGRHTFNVLREGEFRTDGMKRDEQGRPYKSTRKGRLYFAVDGPAVTDVWHIPFLSTVSNERTGYPTQKPERLLDRIVRASSNEGDLVADFFCGSGTTVAVAARLRRRWLACDVAGEATKTTRQRLNALKQPAHR